MLLLPLMAIVPEVMDAIHYHEGVIRPIVAIIKSLASAISIGTGGAVGREGPIIQIGSSMASTLGQIIPMPRHAHGPPARSSQSKT